jgi:hypothetical protein
LAIENLKKHLLLALLILNIAFWLHIPKGKKGWPDVEMCRAGFFFQFSDVAEVAIIHEMIKSDLAID